MQSPRFLVGGFSLLLFLLLVASTLYAEHWHSLVRIVSVAPRDRRAPPHWHFIRDVVSAARLQLHRHLHFFCGRMPPNAWPGQDNIVCNAASPALWAPREKQRNAKGSTLEPGAGFRGRRQVARGNCAKYHHDCKSHAAEHTPLPFLSNGPNPPFFRVRRTHGCCRGMMRRKDTCEQMPPCTLQARPQTMHFFPVSTWGPCGNDHQFPPRTTIYFFPRRTLFLRTIPF